MTTSVSRGLHILCIKFKVTTQRLFPSYLLRLTFYPHLKDTGMLASLHYLVWFGLVDLI